VDQNLINVEQNLINVARQMTGVNPSTSSDQPNAVGKAVKSQVVSPRKALSVLPSNVQIAMPKTSHHRVHAVDTTHLIPPRPKERFGSQAQMLA
jgi:hypothetical protein